ncbi:MAG TPA: hypothetical protein VK469_12230, partial [Candidatus Kapabacteria bacterium]|nr:hypothetical protein [Candidatus Kapabacteria bacterium]
MDKNTIANTVIEEMLIPTKYENLNKNLLVAGVDVISHLRKKSYNIEELFQLLKKEKGMNLNQYFNCLTFLWLADIVVLENV